MYKIRSFIFLLAFWLWGAALATIMLICQIFGMKILVKLKKLWLSGVMLLARGLLKIDYRIIGLENLPSGPCLFAPKHQSIWDAFIPGLILPNPGYVFKQELLNIPVFGALLKRWPIVALNRQASTSALRTLISQAQDLFAKRQPQLVIFPEGTRKKPGDAPAYKAGVVMLYEKLGVPLVPVALNSGLYWRKGFLNYRPGTIILEILPPIPAGLDRKAAMSQLQDVIETKSNELAAAHVSS